MSGGGRSASLSRTSIVVLKTALSGTSSSFVAKTGEVWTFEATGTEAPASFTRHINRAVEAVEGPRKEAARQAGKGWAHPLS